MKNTPVLIQAGCDDFYYIATQLNKVKDIHFIDSGHLFTDSKMLYIESAEHLCVHPYQGMIQLQIRTKFVSFSDESNVSRTVASMEKSNHN